MELETDKAVVEVPSSVTGTIGEVRVKEGDKLRVGQVIFTVEQVAGQAKAAIAAVPSAAASPPTFQRHLFLRRLFLSRSTAASKASAGVSSGGMAPANSSFLNSART